MPGMQPLIVQVEKVGAHSAQTIAFDYSPVRIGRNPLNDLNLGDGFVSQWHAVVRFDAHNIVYVDLGSRNGTTVNGRRLGKNEEVVIDSATDLRIGQLRLHMLRGDAPPELLNVPRATAFLLGSGADAPQVESTMYADQAQAQQVLVGLRNARAGLGARPQQPAMVAQPVLATTAPVPPRSATVAAREGNLYAEYRQAWSRLRDQVASELNSTPAERRAELARSFEERFPNIGREPEYTALLKQHGIHPSAEAEPEMKEWLGRLTNGLYPPPMVKTNTAMTMERLGAVIEVFSQAFVELRRAQQEFCHEMALDQIADNTILYKTEDPRVVLAYLLDPTSNGNARIHELSRAFADFALHQVALVSGVTDGARAVLDQLSPDSVTRGITRNDGESDDGFLSRILSSQPARLWKRFLTQYENLVEGDRFTRELFGRPFARSYFRMTGGRISHVPGP